MTKGWTTSNSVAEPAKWCLTPHYSGTITFWMDVIAVVYCQRETLSRALQEQERVHLATRRRKQSSGTEATAPTQQERRTSVTKTKEVPGLICAFHVNAAEILLESEMTSSSSIAAGHEMSLVMNSDTSQGTPIETAIGATATNTAEQRKANVKSRECISIADGNIAMSANVTPTNASTARSTAMLHMPKSNWRCTATIPSSASQVPYYPRSATSFPA